MLMDVKKEYKKLAKKHKLPRFEDLDHAFEIRGILCDSCILLRDVRRKIVERVDGYVELLQPVIQPDNVFIDFHEYNAFTDQERDRLLLLFKRLIRLDREALLVMTDDSDKANAKFIIDVYTQWKDIQKEMGFIAEKLKSSWEKEVNIKQKLEYLG